MSARFAAALKESGLTVKEVAKMTGLSVQTVRNVIRRPPGQTHQMTALLLAGAVGKPVQWLFAEMDLTRKGWVPARPRRNQAARRMAA